jgi:hypothetical protein
LASLKYEKLQNSEQGKFIQSIQDQYEQLFNENEKLKRLLKEAKSRESEARKHLSELNSLTANLDSDGARSCRPALSSISPKPQRKVIQGSLPQSPVFSVLDDPLQFGDMLNALRGIVGKPAC